MLLKSPDGETCAAEIVSIFDLDGRDYALLVNADGTKGAGQAGIAIMRVTRTDQDRAVFHAIDDRAEFAFVTAHLREAGREGWLGLTGPSILSEYKARVLAEVERRIGRADAYEESVENPFEKTRLFVWDTDTTERSCFGTIVWTFALDGHDYVMLDIGMDPDLSDDDLEEGPEHVAYGLMRIDHRGDKVIFENIERDDEFDRVTAHLRESPAWDLPGWTRPGASHQPEPSDPSEALSRVTLAFSAPVAARIGHADCYEVQIDPDGWRDPSTLLAFVATVVVQVPTGLLEAVPSTSSRALMRAFVEEVIPWVGYADFYELIRLNEVDSDEVVVRLKGSPRPDLDHPFKILRVFPFAGSHYAMLCIGYQDGSDEPFEPVGYGLMQVSHKSRQAVLRDIATDDEFERVRNHLRELAESEG